MSEENLKPWYHKGLRFECQRCGNCCRTHGDFSFVYMMDLEVAQIAGYLGLEEDEFRRRYCARDQGWTVIHPDYPSCPFLTEQGTCGVYPVRPMQCRTWPFWKENLRLEVWEESVVPTCPGIGKGPLHSAEEVERIARENEEWYEGD